MNILFLDDKKENIQLIYPLVDKDYFQFTDCSKDCIQELTCRHFDFVFLDAIWGSSVLRYLCGLESCNFRYTIFVCHSEDPKQREYMCEKLRAAGFNFLGLPLSQVIPELRKSNKSFKEFKKRIDPIANSKFWD